MNYTIQLNSHIYQLQCDLWDIGHLQIDQFVSKTSLLIGSGFESNVVSFILQAIRQYRFERSLLKYIRIIDKLLKHKAFIIPIQNVIVQLYYQAFVSFFNQRWFNEIDELKILRKLWISSIHPSVLTKMRQVILVATNCDIDGGFKPEAIKMIKKIYENRYKMNPEQLKMYLPYEGKRDKQNIKNIEEIKQQKQSRDSKEFKRSPQTDVHDEYESQIMSMKRSYPRDQSYKEENQEEGPRKMVHQNVNNYNYFNINSISSFNNSYSNSFQNNTSNSIYSAYQPNLMNPMKSFKSQKSQNVEKKIQVQIQMASERNKEKINYEQMLEKLNSMNRFECKTCGKSFKTEKIYDQHLHSHFLQNRKAYQLKAKKYKVSNLQVFNTSEQQWIKQSCQNVFQQNRFFVPSQKEGINLFKSQYICPICGNQFSQEFLSSLNNEDLQFWAFTDSVKVEINGKLQIAHHACFLDMQDSQ